MLTGKGRPLSLDTKAPPAPPQSHVLAEWGMKAELLIKRGMTQRAWGYRELAEALGKEGLRVSTPVLNRRINRGNFSAAFLLACLAALGNKDDDLSVMTATKVARDKARR